MVLLEDDEGGVARVLPDITFVDCGTVQVNTECSVEIAPRKTPFRLGIRAFNLANKDGSFVLVDNILYKAELCKVASAFFFLFSLSSFQSISATTSKQRHSPLELKACLSNVPRTSTVKTSTRHAVGGMPAAREGG